jgi:branched-chain amino acid transport system ATP-binding protein
VTVRTPLFIVICLAVAALVFAGAVAVGNDYVFFAGYVILQYVVLSTAWNILGGYCGYVNFGSAAFFALGAYSTVAIYKLMAANDLPHLVPMPVLMLVGGVVSGVVGFGMGYLTLRLRGAFFAIATLALAVVLQTLIVNWDFVGGSRGAYILRPEEVPLIGSYIKYLFLVMLLLAVGSLVIARLLAARLWLCHHPRRRIGGGSLRRADAEIEADRDHDFRRADGHGWRAVPLLHRLSATVVDVRPGLRRQLDRHAADRRHHELGRAADRHDFARLAAADRDGDDIVRRQSAAGRRHPGRLRHRRAQWHHRARSHLLAAQARRFRRPPPRRDRRAGIGTMTDSGMTNLLEVESLSKRFGGFVALENICLNVPAGERLGLIGPNGSGKSTLVNCICGTLQNEQGSVRFDGRAVDGLAAHQRTRMGLSRSFQLPRPFVSLSLLDNIRIPLLYAVASRGAGSSASDVEARCTDLLREVGLDNKARHLPRDLTQVEMRKLELARAMAAEPKLLIADESMAGLTHSEVEEILALLVRLNEKGVTIILIEHIMRAVMSFSRRLVVLVSGKKIADGLPDEVMRNPEVEKAYLG